MVLIIMVNNMHTVVGGGGKMLWCSQLFFHPDSIKKWHELMHGQWDG